MSDMETTQNLPLSPPAGAPKVFPARGAPQSPPAQSLGYSTPTAAGGRPGIVTAIGIISIIVACLSFAASLSVGLQAVGFMIMAGGAGPARPPAAAAPPTVVAPGGRPIAGTPATLPATNPATLPAASTGTALTSAEVQAVLQKVQAASNAPLNPAQVATLQAELQNPQQQLVRPGTAASPIVSVQTDNDGALVLLTGGWVQIDPQGQVVASFVGASPFAAFKVPPAPLALVAVDAVGGVILAILLLVAGILVFRRSPAARRLHRLYAWLKLPVALLGAVGMGWMYSAFLGNILRGPAQAGVSHVFWFWGIAMGLLGCAYPVALLIALRSRTVRGYYQSISGGT